MSGVSIPTWLANPRPVLLKRNNRNSKYDPMTEEVWLLEANQHYAHVRYPDSRETTVSTWHLASLYENKLLTNELPLKKTLLRLPILILDPLPLTDNVIFSSSRSTSPSFKSS